MIIVEKVNTQSRSQVRRFVDLPFRLYAGHPQWVPPLRSEVAAALDRRRHPFYERSDADFFIAVRDGRDVGRIAALENRPFNAYHGIREADFYFFDCENDPEVASALFEHVFEWARARNLDRAVGPKGFSALDGYGVLVEGFEHRQLMMMMNYNYPYYPSLIEALGFQKEVDFISRYMHKENFQLPERMRRIAERVRERGKLQVKRFHSKRELIEWAPRIGEAYNKAFVRNWEYYPLSPRQVDFVVKNVLTIADHRLIKVITHGEDVVGFLFAFPDLSAALQRIRGRISPVGIIRLLLEMRRTKWVALNGAGVLPEYHGNGGNALLYSEIEKTVNEFRFEHADLTQVAETALQMQRDLEQLGARIYKRHRVYARHL
jgi:GNAT superfamily N-acetyltransferase